MTKGTKPKICPNEREVTKFLTDFNDFCKGLKDARACVLPSQVDYTGHSRRFRDHYLTKTLVDEAATEPQRLRRLHDNEDLWEYARPATGFSYGKHASDKLCTFQKSRAR